MIRPALPADLRETPISVLAYIGDAVFELYLRLDAANRCAGPSGQLHGRCVKLARASAQAEAVRRLMPCLTEEEQAVFRRGRNAEPGSRSKHADPVSYRDATGLEALVGYLYLAGANDRLDNLMQHLLSAVEIDHA